MDCVVGTAALDTLGHVKALPAHEATGGVGSLHPDAPGGTGGNVATALARLGAPPRLLSAVGPDFAGSAYERALLAAGVDLSALQRVGTPTSRAYVFFDEAGRQVTYFFSGASREFRPRPEDVRGRTHFCAGEIRVYPALMEAADWVSFDPGQELFHRDLADIVACFPLTDLLFVNRHEADVLEKAGWGVARILKEGVGTVVESRGADGTLVHTPSGRFAAPAVPAQVRDPTGAGDAHRAGYLFALARGAAPGVAARFAAVMGSFAIEEVGAQVNLPTLEQALERYHKAFGERPF